MDKQKHIIEIDYLKGVLILLMVAFHLVYFSGLYPYAKEVVYSFHMPGFLLISGFLMNVEKNFSHFIKMLFGLFVPYIIMESGYIFMASQLPVNEHIEELDSMVFIEKLLQHPIGPYWYLHTLIICGIVYFSVFRLVHLSLFSRLFLIGLLLFFLSFQCELLVLRNGLFFLVGVIIRSSGLSFTAVFRPSWMAAVAFIIIIAIPSWFDYFRWGMFFCALCGLLWIYSLLNKHLCRFILFVGRNTLLILLFSPAFTLICKYIRPFVDFDRTGFLFLIISLVITVIGSVFIGYIMDKLHLSRYILWREKALLK